MDLYKVIKKVLVTEKGESGKLIGKHVFYVHSEATKIDVKKAVELLYHVPVKDVNVVRVPKKTRLVGRGREVTKRRAQKKVIVTLLNKSKGLDPLKIKSEK